MHRLSSDIMDIGGGGGGGGGGVQHELAPLPSKQNGGDPAEAERVDHGSRRCSNANGSLREEHQLPVPGSLVVELPPQQKWNDPAINIWRVVFSCYGIMLMGLHDGAIGALLPYIESYYDVSYVVVSAIFVSPVVGFLSSVLLLNTIHEKLGQRGIAILGPFTRLVAYIIICLHPPFPVVACAYALTGFGNGVEDAAWNAWIGHLRSANEMLGIFHGAYGLGGILGPLIATALVTRYSLQWYTYAYVMIGLLAFEQVAAPLAFWTADGRAFREEHPDTSGPTATSSTGKSALAVACRTRVVWICSAFMLLYVGLEVSLTGWMTTFLAVVRAAPPFEAGLATTMFWTGATVGRVSLGFVTGRVGEKLAIFIYLAFAVACHLVFYLVPSVPVSLAAIAVEGFFLGPLFPAAIIAATKLLPPHLHVSGVGIAATMGSTGACLLPFAVGAIAEAKGVQVLMPTVLAFLVADAIIWGLLPDLKRRKRE